MAIVGLLIGVLGGVVALLSAGMPDLPRLTLLLEPGLTALGLLLKPLLALFCLTLTVAGRGQLSFEYPAALPEALKTSQVSGRALTGGHKRRERVRRSTLCVSVGPPFPGLSRRRWPVGPAVGPECGVV